MGLDYNIYQSKKKLTIEKALKLIDENYHNAVKTKWSEYYVDFNLKNIQTFKKIKENWAIENDTFHLSDKGLLLNPRDIIHLIETNPLFESCWLSSQGLGRGEALGYRLTIEIKKQALEFEISLPYKDLEKSKSVLFDLLLHLKKEGIHLGFHDYELEIAHVKPLFDQLVDLNSSTKPSFTWQLNINGYSFFHGNGYAVNSQFNEASQETYRMRGIKIGFPDFYFKHRPLNTYSVSLLQALSSYFKDDKIRLSFTSTNPDIIDEVGMIQKGRFHLSSKIDLSKSPLKPNKDLIESLFEIEDNELFARYIRLDKTHDFYVHLGLEGKKIDDLNLKIYIEYDLDQEEDYQEKVEKKLGLELEYIGAG